MNSHLNDLSEIELAELMAKAEKTLAEKQRQKRKAVVAQIKELAASIGVTVEIIEVASTRGFGLKGGKIPVKYRNPEMPFEQWTGRGVKPRWLSTLLEQGRSLEEFLV